VQAELKFLGLLFFATGFSKVGKQIPLCFFSMCGFAGRLAYMSRTTSQPRIDLMSELTCKRKHQVSERKHGNLVIGRK
jgi:hypothetical protein